MKLIQWKPCDEIEAYTVTKLGGISQGSLASLNISYNVGDNYENVLENRKRLAHHLNTDLDHMIASNQTHSTNFAKVSFLDAGKGMYEMESAIKDTDAMYTRERNLYLLCFHADCIPVLLYDRSQKIVGEIHAGWKGNVSEIINKLIQHLIKNENCKPEDIFAFIGPSISYKNFEVGQDVIDLVNKMSFDASDLYQIKENGKYLLDGKSLAKRQLTINNIPDQNITVSPYCTIDNHDLFFSHRKDNKSGRNVSIIKLKPSRS